MKVKIRFSAWLFRAREAVADRAPVLGRMRLLERANRMLGQKLKEAITERNRLAQREPPLVVGGELVLGIGETARLARLMEEAGEVVHAAAMVMRFGWAGMPPGSARPNRQALERELGHLRAALQAMIAGGDVRRNEIAAHRNRKEQQTKEFAG